MHFTKKSLDFSIPNMYYVKKQEKRVTVLKQLFEACAARLPSKHQIKTLAIVGFAGVGLSACGAKHTLPPSSAGLSAIGSTQSELTPVGQWPQISGVNRAPENLEECFSLNITSPNNTGYAGKAQETVRILSQAPAGQYIVNQARSSGVKLCFTFDEEGGKSGLYDPITNNVYITYDAPMPETVMTAAHEFRHAEQATLGFELTTETSITSTAMTVKVMEADAEAFANLITYQLEQKGYDFSSATHSENMDIYRNVYYTFRRNMPQDGTQPTKRQEMQALRAAFDEWAKTPDLSRVYEISVLEGLFNELTSFEAPQCLNFHYDGREAGNLSSLGTYYGGNYITATGGFASSKPQFDRWYLPGVPDTLARAEERKRTIGQCAPQQPMARKF